MKESNITKKDLTILGLRSTFLQASFNYERMQSGGWLWAQLPLLKKIYKDDKKGLSNAMKDNLEFMNTSPPLVSFLMGLLISMEEQKEDRSLILGTKIALFGPLAGIGDALFWFTYLPIVAGISASFAIEGSILGPIIFFLCYVAIFAIRIPLAHLGYSLGAKGLENLSSNTEKLSKAATIIGVTVVGGLVASYVKISVLPEISINETTIISIQRDLIDKIFPNLLPLLYTLAMFALLKFKKIHPVTLIVVTFISVIVLSYLRIL